MAKKHVIFTTSDEKFEDFVLHHWFKSLKENVNLANIDVVIIDYGLNEKQKYNLRLNNVIIYKAKKDGRVNNIRFRDIAKYLKKHKYDQVMATDGGDIIFQTDISPLFEKDKDTFRACTEHFNFSFEKFFFKNSFYKKYEDIIKKNITTTRMINIGMLIGPSEKFRKMSEECYSMIKDKNKFGPEQIGFNYLLYRDGVKILDEGYNFVLETAKKGFFIRNGVFYFRNKKKISVVHNAGGKNLFRAIKNFGYGPEYNKLKISSYIFMRGFFIIARFFYLLKKKLFVKSS